MKRTVFTSLFIFFFIELINGQDINSDTLKKWHWGFSIKFSDFYRIIGNGNSGFLTVEDSTQVSRRGLNAGLIFRRDLSKKFQFETGLFLNNKGYDSKEYIFSETQGKPLMEYYYSVIDEFNFWYLDIPLKFHCKIGNRKLFFSAGGGVIVNILLSAKNNQTITQLTQGVNYQGFPPFSYSLPGTGWSGIGELAINYSFYNSQLSLYPFYERSLFSTSMSGNMAAIYLYSYGIGLNFLQKF